MFNHISSTKRRKTSTKHPVKMPITYVGLEQDDDQNRVQTNPTQYNRGTNDQSNNTSNSSNSNSQRSDIVVPYTKVLNESIKTICGKHRILVYLRGGRTIGNLLVASKDKDLIAKKSRVIYRNKYESEGCDEAPIG